MKTLFIIVSAVLLNAANAQVASSLDTYLGTGNSGVDVRTVSINSTNAGLAIWPHTAGLPLNPSENNPFALTVGGDIYGGDLYCLADTDNTYMPGAWGCVYGASRSGNRNGPVVYQTNKCINCDGGNGGPGFIMWADKQNADTHGNRGYLDVWAWGQNDSEFSNTVNFGNRNASGAAHRRLRILNDGKINIPDLSGAGNALLCIDQNGSVYRGSQDRC